MNTSSAPLETRVSTKQHVLIASCPQLVLNRTQVSDIADAVRSSINDVIKRVVLQFISLESANATSVSALAREFMEIAKSHGKITLVGHHSLERSIREQGLERVFGWREQLNEVLIEEGLAPRRSSKSALDFLNTTVASVADTLHKLLKGAVTPERPIPKQSLSEPCKIDFGAALPLHSIPFKGTLLLGFERGTYTALLSRMAGYPVSELDPGFVSGAGKILKLISSQAQKSVSGPEFGLVPSEMKMLDGVGLEDLVTKLPGSAICIPFETEIGKFWMILVVAKKEAPAAVPAAA